MHSHYSSLEDGEMATSSLTMDPHGDGVMRWPTPFLLFFLKEMWPTPCLFFFLNYYICFFCLKVGRAVVISHPLEEE